MKTIKLTLKGMTCPSCSAAVHRLVSELPGIATKEINHVTDDARIVYDENLISEHQIIAKINEGHYKVAGKEDIVDQVKIPICPTCSKTGAKVPHSVFKSNLKPSFFNQINFDEKYYICLNRDCHTAYYNENITLNKSSLKRELWFKSGTERKIICYCNNIDREQIKEAVQKESLETWEDITGHYRNKVIEKCEILNPTGLCCRDTFAKVIQKFKNERM